MSAHKLLVHFERLSDAPDAAQRLRRLILALALRGKLVEQDSSDAPVALSHVGEEASQGDGRFPLPASWLWLPLASVCHLEMGQSPSSEHYNQYRDGIPFFQGKADFGALYPTPRYWCTRPTKIALKGDVLVSVRAPVGPTNIADVDCCIGRGLAALRPGSLLTRDFLLLALRGSEEVLASTGYGTTFAAITKKQLTKFLIPVPSLGEQYRIVAKVGELIALCDELEAAQTERERQRGLLTTAALDRMVTAPTSSFEPHARFVLSHSSVMLASPRDVAAMRQAILDLAVGGKLTRHGSKSNGTVDQVWTEVPLGSLLSEDSRNGYSRKPDGAVDGIPILKISAGTVREDGIVSEKEHKLIGKVTSTDRDRYRLRPGDLLACRFNGNRDAVGRLAVFRDTDGLDPIYPDKLIRFRADVTKVLPDVLRWFSRSTLLRERIAEHSATTVGNWGISAGNLKRVLFPVPPLAEQHRVVTRVEELMAVCDELERSLAAVQTGRTRLLEAVLHDALSDAGLNAEGAVAAAR